MAVAALAVLAVAVVLLLSTLPFVASVFLDADSPHTLEQLLTSPAVFVNEASAPLFGVKDVKGPALVKRSMDPAQRAGVFTTPAYLAVHATTTSSHPTKRGVVKKAAALRLSHHS